MTAADSRSTLVEAVRRDLFGPTGPDDVGWPGASPVTLGPSSSLENHRQLRGLFVAADGEEVLAGSPLRRYGIGILFPAGMSRRQEEQLDETQSELALDIDVPEQEGPPSDLTESEATGQADAEDAAEVAAAPFRPRSMAVSFLVRAGAETSLEVQLLGGRYEPMQVSVGGVPYTMWRRRQTQFAASMPVGESGTLDHDLADGPMQVRLGAAYRQHPAGTVVTVYALNRTPAPGDDLAGATAASVFQASLIVRAPEGAVQPYPSQDAFAAEDLSLELLYHQAPVLAVGHGCNAECTWEPGTSVIRGQHFPVEVVRSPIPDAMTEGGRALSVDMDALGRWEDGARRDVEEIFTEYGRWITARRAELTKLPVHLLEVAMRHLDACERFQQDATDGWSLAVRNPEVRRVLCWTSEAMANQRRAYAADARALIIEKGKVVGASGPSPHANLLAGSVRWRAFQIAFLLASLPAAVESGDERHPVVDIIWMPTGGGKTEAYSAVAAFTILWRRRQQVEDKEPLGKQGVTVMMRYTLRLLTAQQLQRAAALICALETIRLGDPGRLGVRRFSIGAWLGRASTPNDRSGARKALKDWGGYPTNRGFLLTRCPWCAAAIGHRQGAKEVDGYKIDGGPNAQRVMAYCPDPSCRFNPDRQQATGQKPLGLPVYEVDEDLYHQPPTFLVGTIDKFTQLTWRADTATAPGPARFFGIAGGTRTGAGPALLIQDELHLISGPLGSLDALYEPVIESLCDYDGGTRPRIVAATATTRRFTEQTEALYGRSGTRLIPPPGLTAADNFFSRTDDSSPGKLFVGICAPGFGKTQEAQVRVLAALSHAAGSLDVVGQNADPWWTNLCFFSSRRSLGFVQSLCQTHLRGHTWRLHSATGVAAGPVRSTGSRAAQRSMVVRVELTAQATSDVSEAMNRLAIPYGKKGCADLCFATSMIEVGVDIDRLGLLTMFGQPKSASQYIQVAGRVGRREREVPGVVFVVLSPYNSRDRSHFEQFSTLHRRLYASVEPVSVTPFTPAALARGLAGSVAAWLRQAVGATTPAEAGAHLDDAVAVIAARTGGNGTARENLDRQHRELAGLLDSTHHGTWGTLRPGRSTEGFLRPLNDGLPTAVDDEDTQTSHWLVPTSMRSVDAESGARALRHTMSAPATRTKAPATAGQAPADDEDQF